MTLTNIAASGYSQAGDVLLLAATSTNRAPQLGLVFGDSIVEAARIIAAFAGLIWVFYLLLRNIMPGGRGGQGMQAMMGQGMSSMKVLLAVVGIICLMDINYMIDITNFLLKQLWDVKEMIGSGKILKE